MIIRKGYKYRLKIKSKQVPLFRQFSGCCRFVWNKALALQKHRLDGYIPLLKYGELSALLTLWRHSEEYFFLKVQGDSMNLKFNNNDLVLVQKQSDLENGDIGIILVNGSDATIKRFKKESNFVILEPMSTNSEHRVQIYNCEQIEISVIGKVIRYMGQI
jgi:hypothetical protein